MTTICIWYKPGTRRHFLMANKRGRVILPWKITDHRPIKGIKGWEFTQVARIGTPTASGYILKAYEQGGMKRLGAKARAWLVAERLKDHDQA